MHQSKVELTSNEVVLIKPIKEKMIRQETVPSKTKSMLFKKSYQKIRPKDVRPGDGDSSNYIFLFIVFGLKKKYQNESAKLNRFFIENQNFEDKQARKTEG